MQRFLTNNEHSLVKMNFPDSADSKEYDAYGEDISLRKNEVYKYNGKLYAKVIANSYEDEFTLSNGVKYKKGDVVWVEVSPIRWLNDKKDKVLLSERCLFGGIPFNHTEKYNGNFENTDLGKYLDNHFSKEIMAGYRLSNNFSTDLQTNTSGNNFIIDDNLEKDIRKLLNDINILLEKIPEEYRIDINNIIKPLIDNYIINRSKLKPSFAMKKNVLELPGTDLNSIKNHLIVIISLVIDILNLLNENSDIIEDTDLKNIKDEIKTELNKSFEDIDNKKIDDLEKYNKELREIMNKVAKIKINVILFIKEMKRYYDIVNIKK